LDPKTCQDKFLVVGELRARVWEKRGKLFLGKESNDER
jgi:hypothetical protein